MISLIIGLLLTFRGLIESIADLESDIITFCFKLFSLIVEYFPSMAYNSAVNMDVFSGSLARTTTLYSWEFACFCEVVAAPVFFVSECLDLILRLHSRGRMRRPVFSHQRDIRTP